MLLSLGLRSARGWCESPSGVHACFSELYLGMRLDMARESNVLLVKDGSEGAGEPEDRGCETQSSERFCNHASPIATKSVVVE